MGLQKSKQKISRADTHARNSSCFEDLSNDLIYELFDYLSYHNICLAFDNINSRLRNLIDRYSHYVNLQQQKQNNNLLLPLYIHSLKINARYQLALIDLSTIVSLRGLILSNLSPCYTLHVLNTLSLKELEYIYLGVCHTHYECEQEQLREIQQKILSLGELKLNKCVFRMKFYADIDQLPIQLPALEYLRIDGCENVLMVNKLLHRIPNLSSLYVSILGQTQTDNHHIEQSERHECLTNLTIRLESSVSLEDLKPLFNQNGARVKKLIIYLSSVRENSWEHGKPDHPFVNLYGKTTAMINQSLPQLTNFQLRQYVISQDSELLIRSCYFSPYVAEVSTSLENIRIACRSLHI